MFYVQTDYYTISRTGNTAVTELLVNCWSIWWWQLVEAVELLVDLVFVSMFV